MLINDEVRRVISEAAMKRRLEDDVREEGELRLFRMQKDLERANETAKKIRAFLMSQVR